MMHRNKSWLKRLVKGFTLVELLVVIAIISVLAAIALPAYNNYAIKSRFTEVVASTGAAKAAVGTCAATGDCVVSNAIVVPQAVASIVYPSTWTSATEAVGGTANYNAAIMAAVEEMVAAEICSYHAQDCDAYQMGASGTMLANLGGLNGTAAQATQATEMTAFFLNGSSNNNINVYASNGATQVTLSATDLSNLATQWAAIVAANPPTAAIPGMPMPCIGTTSGCAPSTKYVQSMSVGSTGVVTATASTSAGLNAENFTLTPSYSSGRVDWVSSGSCKTRAGGALC